ncbi:MAG: ROK family protein [Nanoarchaeota archaeon]
MVLSLDIGGSNIRIAEVRRDKIKNKRQVKTPETKKEIIKEIIGLIEMYGGYRAICVSTAGFEYKGRIQGALNLDFNDVPLRKILHRKFKVPVYIQNDARCAALAELKYGAGRRFKNFVLLTLGTGIGGAVVINRRLYLGKGTAGEIGSMLINKDIYEHLASGTASVALAKKAGFKHISSLKLEELAKKHNKKALNVYKKVGYYLGVGLANLSYELAPDCFIIGGGFSRVRFIFPEAKKTLRKKYRMSSKPEIIKAKLGDNAGLIGAALLPKYQV